MVSGLRNPRSVVGILLGGLIALNVYAYHTLSRSQDASFTMQESLNECQQLSQKILDLRQKPLQVESREQEIMDLVHRIEEAAKTAEIPLDLLLRIDPEPPRRIGESPYQEQWTHVDLLNLSLRQLITFLYTLEMSEAGLKPLRLRIGVPRDQSQEDRWNVEFSLTYLIYAPMRNAIQIR